jgi:hypothetical protein
MVTLELDPGTRAHPVRASLLNPAHPTPANGKRQA